MIAVWDEFKKGVQLLPNHKFDWQEVPNGIFRYWYGPHEIWSCKFKALRADWDFPQWTKMDERRTWWNNIRQLQKFVP